MYQDVMLTLWPVTDTHSSVRTNISGFIGFSHSFIVALKENTSGMDLESLGIPVGVVQDGKSFESQKYLYLAD